MPPSDLPWRDKWWLVVYIQSVMLAGQSSVSSTDTSVIPAPCPVRCFTLPRHAIAREATVRWELPRTLSR